MIGDAHSRSRCAVKDIGLFVAHTIGSWLFIPGVAAFLTFSSGITSRRAHWILTETPLFPVQILLGLVLGAG